MADPEQRVGPWRLLRRLGSGGNASVWEATRTDAPGEPSLALKIINTKKVEREPYQRFVREITFLREHQDVPGILSLLEAHLPASPSRADQPWLAMPIATPIAQALAEKPLGDVVAAVAEIADTLARLESEFGIAHRDIKPGNLYELDGSILIGDFGLVALPDSESLNVEGRPLGPAHYTAYEMILDPGSADPHKADVYSLGKTLWVLATGLAFPPEGHQPVGTRGFQIGDFRPHPRADVLDHEIDIMTRLHPEERPTKAQVARDLRAWADLANEAGDVFDVSAARSRLRAKLEKEITASDIRDQQKEFAYAAVRRLQDLTAPLNDALKQLHPRTRIDLADDKLTANTLRSHAGLGWGHEILFRWHRCSLVAPFDRTVSVSLRMGRSLELRDDGVLLLHLMVDVGLEGVMSTFFHWQSDEHSAPAGSIEAEKMLELGVAELSDALRQGIDVFVENVPDDAK
ncbi:MAG: protein kinase [Actinomycetota bacterium]|nr:protein kinase [Actinomycetota bacterium]